MTFLKFQPARFDSLVSQLAHTALNELASAVEQDAPTVRPSANIRETADGFSIEVAATGFAKDEIKIAVEKDTLTVSASKETKSETTDDQKWHRREFTARSFSRSFRLPETVDPEAIAAKLENGILTLDLVKKPETKPLLRTVEIA